MPPIPNKVPAAAAAKIATRDAARAARDAADADLEVILKGTGGGAIHLAAREDGIHIGVTGTVELSWKQAAELRDYLDAMGVAPSR